MPRISNVISISLPPNLTKAVDKLSKQMDQTRSELMRDALREYIADMEESRQRFLDAYKKRSKKTIPLKTLLKKYNIE